MTIRKYDGALERDEQFQQLQDLKSKLKQLQIVVDEGESAKEFMSSSFYPVFEKTFKSLLSVYNADAHKAARDSRAEISNYLGREEALRDVFSIIAEFETKALSAVDEIKVIEDQIREITQILASPEMETTDVGGAMG